MLTVNLLRPPDSYVYFIADLELTAVKIGLAKYPRARLAELQIGSPQRLQMLAMFAGGQQDEAAMHEHFADARIDGEWFRPVDDLLYLVALLAPWRVSNTEGDPELEPTRQRFRSAIARRERPDGFDAAGRYIGRM